MIIICAGNYREFLFYCRKNDLNHRDTEQVVYATEFSLRGRQLYKDDEVVYYGTFSRRSDHVVMQRIHEDLAILEATRLDIPRG